MGVVSFTSSLISMVVTGMLSIIFSIYMLGGREKLLPQCRRLLRAYTPSGVADRVLEVVLSLIHISSVRRYTGTS